LPILRVLRSSRAHMRSSCGAIVDGWGAQAESHLFRLSFRRAGLHGLALERRVLAMEARIQ
jgi:hypothetical protein